MVLMGAAPVVLVALIRSRCRLASQLLFDCRSFDTNADRFVQVGSGNLSRFRVGSDDYWIAGCGPSGTLTISEAQLLYQRMGLAGIERRRERDESS